jgi:hypothetical protein
MELMMDQPLHATLHRTAKYFMDSGRAQSSEEAMDLLRSFGLTITVGPEIGVSQDAQIALLTLVNLARRTFLGGVEVIGLEAVPALSRLTLAHTLADAVVQLGGRLAPRARGEWPMAVIGSAKVQQTAHPAWRLTWQGWRAGVVPLREGWELGGEESIPLAPALAAAVCAAEVFAYLAGDHLMAGKRACGMSLWKPGADWTKHNEAEPVLAFLPSRLWLIGLGNLGQAYAWLLACLPYAPAGLELVLQDFDRLATSNDSTSILTGLDAVGRMKTRWVSSWLEMRGITTLLEERRFGAWTHRTADEPAVALCGVDNASARATLEHAGFDLVIESGLGAGPQSFRNFSMHSFPGSRSAEQIWPTTLVTAGPDVSNMPAYSKLKEKGLDQCGLAQLASRTVGVPFVGLLAGAVVIGEILRRLHGGFGFDVISGSALCLSDIERSAGKFETYSHGFVPASF